jgi:hypothetical protein
MKKCILSLVGIAILAAICTIIVFSMKTEAKNTDNWEYYTQYVKKNGHTPFVVLTEPTPNNPKTSEAPEELISIFEEVKQAMREDLKDYSGLDWDTFESVVPVVAKEILPGRTDITGQYYDGKMILSENALSSNRNHLKKIICHEMFHSLTAKEKNYRFYEGLTEYYAQSLYPDPNSGTYFFATKFVEVYVSKYGFQKAIDNIPYGKLEESFNEICKQPNLIDDLYPLFYYTEMGMFEFQYVSVLIEALANFSVEIGANVEVVADLNDVMYTGYANKAFYEHVQDIIWKE